MNKSFIVPPTEKTEKPKTTQQRQTERQMGTNSTTDPATLKIPCYKNWDQCERRGVNDVRLVSYYKLLYIVEPLHMNVPHNYISLRNQIKSLTISTVGKYKRFPYTGCFRDINLNVKENADLGDMLTATSVTEFQRAGEKYLVILTGKGALMEQWTFEAKYGLQWDCEPET